MRVGKRLLPLSPQEDGGPHPFFLLPRHPLHRSNTNNSQAVMLENRWTRYKDDLNLMTLVVCHVTQYGDSIQEAVRVFPLPFLGSTFSL
jgi:hypothetical protein